MDPEQLARLLELARRPPGMGQWEGSQLAMGGLTQPMLTANATGYSATPGNYEKFREARIGELMRQLHQPREYGMFGEYVTPGGPQSANYDAKRYRMGDWRDENRPMPGGSDELVEMLRAYMDAEYQKRGGGGGLLNKIIGGLAGIR